MSLRRVGYIDGRPVNVDEGPGAARVAGFGGRMVTAAPTIAARAPLHIPTPQETVRRHERNERAATLKRELAGDPRPNTERCGFMLPVLKEPCVRYLGHGHDHKSRYALDNAAKRRRKWNAA